MKIASSLVILAMVLAVLGAGLSYSGYGESLRVSTVTSTQSFTSTSTSTRTITSVSTETHVSTMTGSESILDETFDLQSWGAYFCHWQYYNVTIDAGQVHVSYSSSAGAVDFWLLDEKEFTLYKSTKYCGDLNKVGSVFHQFGSSTYEADVTIPSSGAYHVVLLNRSPNNSTITVKMDYSVPRQTVVTETEERTYSYYSTEQSPLVTETVTLSTQHGQLGMLFYGGIGLIIVAVILLAFSVVRRKPSPAPTRIYEGPAAVAPPAPAAAQTPVSKFCINCGAPLPAHAGFCNKCGSKQ
jgi:hypothetical protein